MSRTMEQQMAHNMNMRGGGHVEFEQQPCEMAMQLARNEEMRGYPKPQILVEDNLSSNLLPE